MAGSHHAALVAFVNELAQVRRLCGSPSLNDLVAHSANLPYPLARSTISDKLNAKSLPDWDFVASFLAACRTHAGRMGMPLQPDILALDEWDSRHLRLLGELDVARRDERLATAADLAARPRDAADTSADARPVLRHLPAAVRTFVGRVAQIRELAALADESEAVVIAAIHGPAGIGTSALAVHAAHLLSERFPDGQLYVDLRSFDPNRAAMSAADAIRVLLEALAVPSERVPASLDARVNVYRSLLADRRVLVLLDNARDADQVRPLLPAAPGSLVLVASRDSLTDLVARDGAHPVPVGALTVDEARQLLATRIDDERVRAETSAVDLIIRRCARVPLALCGVAARASAEPTVPLATIARGLRTRPSGRGLAWLGTRSRPGVLAGVVASAVVGCAMLAGPTDSGATASPGGHYVTASNASDPYIVACVNPGTQRDGLCLYTSQDLGAGAVQDNEYPMDGTRVFWSENGTSWQDMGVALTESQYPWVPGPVGRLGAPAAARSAEGSHYLFAPDVSDARDSVFPNPGAHRSSRIGVSRSAGPFGPFAYVDFVRIADDPSQPYMGDPAVFTTDGRQHLLWADGDADTCGGISIGELSRDMTRVASRTAVRIDGVGALGGCTPTAVGGGGLRGTQPYLRGPALYDLAAMTSLPVGLPGRYTLVFAAKPESVPEDCALMRLGHPGTDYEVIAYATSDAVTGPYTYQGIIMCGSATERTNRATIAEFRTPGGLPRLVMIYHDGAVTDGAHNRKLHADCLMFHDGRILTTHRTADGLDWCLSSPHIVALRFRQDHRIVAAQLQTPSGYLYTNHDRIGWWEQFELIDRGNGTVALRARNGRYVAPDWDDADRPLLADRDVVERWGEFRIVRNSDGSVSLQSVHSGEYVTADQDSDGRLLTNGDEINASERFDLIDLYG